MNYLTESRRNALSSEYVLGTLQGPARVRYQRILMQQPDMRKTLWRWENHLNALGGSLPPIEPAPEVWQKIQTRLGFDEQGFDRQGFDEAAISNVIRFPEKQKPANRWQWMAGISTAAAIVLAVFLFVPFSGQFNATSQLAVVQGEKAQALWLIELNKDNISVQATAKFQPQQDKDYELWIVAKDGRAPISLGLLPKQGKLVLPRKAIIDKVEIAALAVSLEPLGGSPNGQPTTVLYTADLIAI